MITLLNRKEKRGLSDVVATVLIVLLALAAVAIIWTFIKPLFDKTGNQIGVGSDCMSYDAAPVSCVLNATAANVTAQLKRGTSAKLKVIVEDKNGLTSVSATSNAISTLQTTTIKEILLPTGGVSPYKAKVAVVVVDSNSVDSTCDASTDSVACA